MTLSFVLSHLLVPIYRHLKSLSFPFYKPFSTSFYIFPNHLRFRALSHFAISEGTPDCHTTLPDHFQQKNLELYKSTLNASNQRSTPQAAPERNAAPTIHHVWR